MTLCSMYFNDVNFAAFSGAGSAPSGYATEVFHSRVFHPYYTWCHVFHSRVFSAPNSIRHVVLGYGFQGYSPGAVAVSGISNT